MATLLRALGAVGLWETAWTSNRQNSMLASCPLRDGCLLEQRTFFSIYAATTATFPYHHPLLGFSLLHSGWAGRDATASSPGMEKMGQSRWKRLETAGTDARRVMWEELLGCGGLGRASFQGLSTVRFATTHFKLSPEKTQPIISNSANRNINLVQWFPILCISEYI